MVYLFRSDPINTI